MKTEYTAEEAHDHCKKYPDAAFTDFQGGIWRWKNETPEEAGFTHWPKSAFSTLDEDYGPFTLQNPEKWIKLYPDEFTEKCPQDRQAYEWQRWIGTGWVPCDEPYSINPVIEYRYRLKKMQTPQYMTREEMLGFLANTSGIVVRKKGFDTWNLGLRYSLNYAGRDYQWATIDEDGNIGEPKEFIK